MSGRSMDIETTAAPLREEYDQISARLKRSPSGAERDIVKRDIIALFKKVD